nr:PREDICTED: serine/threonine-protein phosphatase 6 regulatory ankyrin repeat subunit C-like [Bemisia tabaci]
MMESCDEDLELIDPFDSDTNSSISDESWTSRTRNERLDTKLRTSVIKAINERNLVEIIQIISFYTEISMETFCSWIHHAIVTKQSDIAKMILRCRRAEENPNQTDFLENGETEEIIMSNKEYLAHDKDLLAFAVARGENKVVRLILSEGADVNSKVLGPFTALHIAIYRQHVQIVNQILIYGADVNSRYPLDIDFYEGSTVLHRAVECGNRAIVEVLINYGADMNAAKSNGLTALHIAIEKGLFEIAEYLIQEGADVNPTVNLNKSENENTKRRVKSEQRLLYDYRIESFDLRTDEEFMGPLVMKRTTPFSAVQNTLKTSPPLHAAIKSRHTELVKLLLEKGADVNALSWRGETVLELAVQTRCPDIVVHVLDYRPDVNNERNRTILHTVINFIGTEKDSIILTKLLQHGFSFNTDDPDLLFKAVRGNFFRLAKLLLENGSDPNDAYYYDDDIGTQELNGFFLYPLHIAVARRNATMVKLLLDFNADPDVQDQDGNSPLLFAVLLSESAIAKTLSEESTVLIDEDLVTLFAAANCDTEVVESLYSRKEFIQIHRRCVERELDLKYLLAFQDMKLTEKTESCQENFRCFRDFLPTSFDAPISSVNPLSIAARAGRTKTVKFLLDKGVYESSADAQGITALHEAATAGHLEVVQIFVEKLVDHGLNFWSEYGSPLYIAAKAKQWEVVEVLLKNGARFGDQEKEARLFQRQVNPERNFKLLLEDSTEWDADSQPVTFIKTLIEQGKQELIIALMSTEAKTTLEVQRLSILHYATKNNAEKLVNYLLKYDSAKFHSDNYNILFLISAKRGYLEILEMLLEAGTEVNSTVSQGKTALHYAALRGDLKMIQVLLEYKADIDSQTNIGETPLTISASRGYKSTVETLLIAGAIINLPDKRGRSPVYNASKNGHVETVELLMKWGSQLDLKTCKGQTALSISARKNYLTIVENLLGSRSDVNSVDLKGKTPLYEAAQRGHTQVVQRLLEHGAATDVRNQNDFTPLMAATEKGHLSTVESLLKFGAKLNTTDKYGQSPLHVAITACHCEIVKLLLKYGTEHDIDLGFQTPLLCAVEEDYLHIADVLIEAGANVNAKTPSRGETPIHLATRKFQRSSYWIEFLLKYGADINAQNGEGRTPLSISTHQSYSVTASFTLLKFGADTEKRDKHKKTPIWYAASEDTKKLELLIE